MWYPNVAALGRDHPVFALDTPGDLNRSVARAPTAPTWSGSSYGGWIALNQALCAPGRVASITLLDPAGRDPPGARFWWWFYLRGLAALAPRRLRRPLAAWLDEPTLAENQIIAAMWAGIRTYRMEPKFPDVLTDDELRRIRVPVLLLTGRRSALISPARPGPRPGSCRTPRPRW